MSPAAEETVDAVVIGAGPNGLVAANALVDAGWDVVVLEAEDTVGGAVRSAEVTAPGFVNDLFSAFYPLAAASPVIRGLHLENHGLEWVHAPAVVAHHLPDGRAAVLHHQVEDTAEGLDLFAGGDGEAWTEMFKGWQQVRDPLLDALFTPFPPIASMTRLLRRLGSSRALEMARLGVLPVRRLADERFKGEGAPLLLTGNAMHSDIPPDAAGSGLLGWLLCMLGQDVGFPVPKGGAQQFANALSRRIIAGTGDVRTGSRVTSIEISGGRATGVRLQNGHVVHAKRAVLADVAAPALYRDLVGLDNLPPAMGRRLDQFQWDSSTIKVNWALSRPVGWRDSGAKGAGTVHLGVDMTGFVDFSADLSVGRIPLHPFLLFGQMTTADPTRSPEGTESAWAYTHVPRGLGASAEAVRQQVDRVREAVEVCAPGFRDSVMVEQVQSPSDLQSSDANLNEGAINAGTSAIHQQLFFRPVPGLGRPETPVRGLFLAGASAHPGGGVHGACGWNAARSALGSEKMTGRIRGKLLHSAWERLLRD